MPYLRVYDDGTLIKQYDVTDASVSIGRSPGNDIVLDNPGVSGQHAAIRSNGTTHVIVDLGSTNGTFVNKRRIDAELPLSFHDEIQIYSYVLKYMPTARLDASEQDETEQPEKTATHDATMEISIKEMEDLEKLRSKKKTPFLLADDPGNGASYKLTSLQFKIGRGKDSDLRIGGWFAPNKAAILIRQHKSYHLIPQKRGKVLVNDTRISRETPLSSGDRISIRGRKFTYQLRADDNSPQSND